MLKIKDRKSGKTSIIILDDGNILAGQVCPECKKGHLKLDGKNYVCDDPCCGKVFIRAKVK